MESIMYIIIGIIVIALIPKIAEDFQKGIAEGNEKKRQKDLTKEVNDSLQPAFLQDACRFCKWWTEFEPAKGKGKCSAVTPKIETLSTDRCEYFNRAPKTGSIQEATGNNSGSTGEASRKH